MDFQKNVMKDFAVCMRVYRDKNKYKCGGRVYEDGRTRKTGKRRGNRARFKRRENTRKRGRKIVLRRWRIWNIVRNCMRNLAYKLKKRSFYGRNPVEAF